MNFFFLIRSNRPSPAIRLRFTLTGRAVQPMNRPSIPLRPPTTPPVLPISHRFNVHSETTQLFTLLLQSTRPCPRLVWSLISSGFACTSAAHPLHLRLSPCPSLDSSIRSVGRLLATRCSYSVVTSIADQTCEHGSICNRRNTSTKRDTIWKAHNVLMTLATLGR